MWVSLQEQEQEMMREDHIIQLRLDWFHQEKGKKEAIFSRVELLTLRGLAGYEVAQPKTKAEKTRKGHLTGFNLSLSLALFSLFKLWFGLQVYE
jgi:hypothetical protein